MKNHWIKLDPFYEEMNRLVNHNRKCVDCGNKMWIAYSDGHIWDVCLSCDEPTSKNSFDLAGYITRYPVPKGKMPEKMEFQDLKGKNWAHHQIHEMRAYRRSD
jgi:hypothetical protein